VAAKVKTYAEREAKILGEIKGTLRTPGYETPDERGERQHKASMQMTSTLADVLVAQSATDPDDLLDLFDESIERGQPERARKVLPLVVATLDRLRRQKVPGAAEAHQVATATYIGWKRSNPSLAAQLRKVRAERQGLEQPIDRTYSAARQHFRFGAAKHGIRL
jgi:hypothetical protein